jgi:hypothetical protein
MLTIVRSRRNFIARRAHPTPDSAMTKVALLVELKAKLGKERELATFLTAQQSMAAVEPGMLAWFFVRLDAQTFALFDVFNEDADSSRSSEWVDGCGTDAACGRVASQPTTNSSCRRAGGFTLSRK